MKCSQIYLQLTCFPNFSWLKIYLALLEKSSKQVKIYNWKLSYQNLPPPQKKKNRKTCFQKKNKNLFLSISATLQFIHPSLVKKNSFLIVVIKMSALLKTMQLTVKLLFLVFTSVHAELGMGSYIFEDLLTSNSSNEAYNKFHRPGHNDSTVNVSVFIHLESMRDISSETTLDFYLLQFWQDTRLIPKTGPLKVSYLVSKVRIFFQKIINSYDLSYDLKPFDFISKLIWTKC